MGSRFLRILLAVIAVLVLVVLLLMLTARTAAGCPVCELGSHRPLVIAHQGGDGIWPSNTLYAFERAVALGVDWLEMDIHATADGSLVVMHDETVDRTTDGTGAIRDMTLAQLKALDAGYDWTADDGQTYPFRGQGITPPALEEVFAAFPDMPMNIEIKQEEPSIAASFCQLIRQYSKEATVLVGSFSDQAMAEFREVCPEVATSAAPNEVINLYVRYRLFLARTYTPKAQAFQVPEYRSGLRVLSPRFVRDSQRRGLDVHAWTINEVDDMQRMIDMGVDGIITDYPDRLLDLLGP